MTIAETHDYKQERMSKIIKIFNLIFAAVPIIPLAILIFLPFGAANMNLNAYMARLQTLSPIMSFQDLTVVDASVLASSSKICGFFELIAFIALIAAICGNIVYVVRSIFALISNDKKPINIKTIIIVDICVSFGIALVSVLLPFLMSLFGIQAVTVLNLVPTIIMVVLGAMFAVFSGFVRVFNIRNRDADLFGDIALENIQKKRKKLFFVNTELCVCAIATAVLALIAVLSDIFTVTYKSNQFAESYVLSVSGIGLLTDPTTIVSQGQQVLSYIVMVVMIVLIALIVLTAISFAGRSNIFNKIAIATICVSTGCCLAIGLVGKYYEMIQDMNKAMILKIVVAAGVNEQVVLNSKFITYEVVSNSIYFLFGALAVLTVVFLRRPYTKAMMLSKEIAFEEEARLPKVVELANSVDINKENMGGNNGYEEPGEEEIQLEVVANSTGFNSASTPTNFDPCPAFTGIDRKWSLYSWQLEQRRNALIENPSLSTLVNFIVQYARDSRLHLFYTQETIAEFLAGLGTTRLSILQGMSGTGKTSLPKIVAEALSSVCDIVEVESAWRDKNELLGYYNEFSKTYTPKKFTEALYRARLNPEVITFIVLDEMNLSRIEYYFSDFLSLMESEPDKRELKLLNIPIERTVDGQTEPYYGLIEGHTIKIPENVWFIGTANRDESTYDISDKVYDRAHTMNFDKRATKVKYYSDPIPPKYLSANTLLALFENAKSNLDFSLDQYPIVAEVEKLLEPYNISFGNRIEMQIESFVKIYTSCFALNENVIRDGLEIILLSKVVRKLEFKSVNDKEELAAEFGKLQLKRCQEFILNLRED